MEDIYFLLCLRISGTQTVWSMKLLAIANQKGGVGKTTTAVNLSTCLAVKGKRVLLVDLDPQGNATSALGLEGTPGQSLYEALVGQADIKEKIVPTRFEHLSMVPADLDLAGAEIEVARLDDHLTRLRDVLAGLNQQVVNEVREHFPTLVYQTIIPRSVRLGEAPSFGKPIIEYEPNGDGAIAYRALAEEFVQRETGQIKFVNGSMTQ